MKIEDFQLQPNQAKRLAEIDALVGEGLSRERAQRIVAQLYDIIDGAWSDLLTLMANPEANQEKALLQTFWISFVFNWAQDRSIMASLAQMTLLDQFAEADGNTRGE